MSVAKRRMASGRFGLEANYISAENGTNTPTQSYTGQYVYCVQYNVVKCTVASNVNGTITFDFSDDGINSRATVVDSVTGGTPYFRVVNVEDQYVRILWSSGSLPASLGIYTSFSKSSGGGFATSSSVFLAAGNAGIGIGGAFPSWTISNLFTLAAGSGIIITGSYPNLTVAATGTSTAKSVYGTGANATNFPRSLTKQFYNLMNDFHVASAVGSSQCIWPVAGTFSNLYVSVQAAMNTGNTRTYTLNVNGTDTALVATIVYPATSGNSGVLSAAVNAGDLVCISYIDTSVGGGGPQAGNLSIAFG